MISAEGEADWHIAKMLNSTSQASDPKYFGVLG
jgi:hypothetical protein